MPSSSVSSSSTSPENTIFQNHPQRYPKARRKAAELAGHVQDMVRRGPRTLIATVIDVSAHLTFGRVMCTTDLGVVPVYGIPYATVVVGMRLLCRQMGGMSTNRSYVFDGYAPNLSGLGLSSGSLLYTAAVYGTSSSPVSRSTTGGISSTSVVGATGYFWSLFFYIPSLPTNGVVTLFQMTATSGGNIIALEYTPTGYLQFRSLDNHGYVSAVPVAPHTIHWVQIQPGLTGNEMLIDGNAIYTGLFGGSDLPTFTGNSMTYTLTFLSDLTGGGLPPLGTWISKIGYGASYNDGVITLPSQDVPESDSDLPSFNLSATQQVIMSYLCEETPGSGTIASSGYGTASSVVLAGNNVNIVATGPY